MSYVLKCCCLATLLLLVVPAATAQDEPEPLNVFHGEIPQAERVYYVAPDGDDGNDGTEAEPFATLPRAVAEVQRGDVIVMRGGVYHHDDIIRIQSPSGFDGEYITLTAYPGEVPILDFSTQPKVRDYHGIRLNANYWHVIGITVRYASHNGIRMDGSFNILEQVTANGNHDTGIHMAGGASNNLIKNSDSFHNFNYDASRTPRIGNNADGFGAKFQIGPGNRYVGCRAWENSDDGFDFWEAQNTITIENSWAFGNGDESVFDDFEGEFEGNGNGFKLGGNFVRADHVVRRSMAFDNFGASGSAKGFDYNNNPGAMTLEHNSAYNNGRNYWFPLDPPTGQAVFLNNLSVTASVHAQLPPSAVVAGNSWQAGASVTEDLFASVDTGPAKGPRQEDGSLPDISLLTPIEGSFLIDGGVAYGLPFYGSSPDIGAIERAVGNPVDPWIEAGSSALISGLRVYDLQAGALWSLETEPELETPPYPDSDMTLSSVVGDIRIDAWIRTAMESGAKNYLFTVADFEVEQGTFLLVAHSDDVTEKPAWLDDFDVTEVQLILDDDGVQRLLTVYRRPVNAGETVILGRNSLDGSADVPMYLAMLGTATSVSIDGQSPFVAGSSLRPGYPNPFSDRTNVAFTLAQPLHVSITVFDVMGREVARLADGRFEAGSHSISWMPTSLAGGVYYIRMQTKHGSETIPAILAR